MRTVFVDVDTQLDFVCPAGALYAPGAERILPAIARLNRFAAAQGFPVVSTADAHTEDDVEFQTWPHHCVIGAWGQRKAESTVLAGRVTIPNRECDFEDILSARDAPQIVVEKQTVDMFQSVNFSRVIEALAADRFVVYGVVTEICVRHAVGGLLQTGRPVVVVSDAIRALDAGDGQRALAEMTAAGAMLAPAAEICGG